MDRPRITRLLCITALAVCGFVVFSIISIKLINRPPFLITLLPSDKSTVVQFIQPVGFDDKMGVSPKFKVDVPISESFQAALTSGTVQIPGAVMEHYDTTLLPGYFRLRIGGTLFDIYSAKIVVDGRDYDWLERPVNTGTTINVSH